MGPDDRVVLYRICTILLFWPVRVALILLVWNGGEVVHETSELVGIRNEIGDILAEVSCCVDLSDSSIKESSIC